MENGKRRERVYVLERRVPITKSEFQSPGEQQNGGPDLIDEPSDAKMLHNEDKRAFALREREFGRHCDVQDNIRFSRRAKQDWWFARASRGQCRSGRAR